MIKFKNPDIRQREKDRSESLVQGLVGDNADLYYNDAEYHAAIERTMLWLLKWADDTAELGRMRQAENQKQLEAMKRGYPPDLPCGCYYGSDGQLVKCERERLCEHPFRSDGKNMKCNRLRHHDGIHLVYMDP